ncbi:unnamed protein product [Cyclocybe aegerita]|uniref:AA9 family lytic polysaccharide monooxygenase n=1 Tax=Cyclocybe aegerita TaxID=1973307 RepID=A0A8S0W3N4_CYCAE|nr:unnamed protein product [Cyclocybe aegerita]
MKVFGIVGVLLATQSVSAHYIFKTLVAGSKTSTKAVRQPQNNSPVVDLTSPQFACNTSPSPADETVSVLAGDTIGFQTDAAIFHKGPAALYLGQAPGAVENWDGTGQQWFKIAEWGATLNPLTFTSLGMSEFTAKIPANVPSGDVISRSRRAHRPALTGAPEAYMSCAQIRITQGGSGNPSKVAIPGDIAATDASVMVNIYDTVASYTPPGPAVYSG